MLLHILAFLVGPASVVIEIQYVDLHIGFQCGVDVLDHAAGYFNSDSGFVIHADTSFPVILSMKNGAPLSVPEYRVMRFRKTVPLYIIAIGPSGLLALLFQKAGK
jgi:hypothetical protein